MAALDFCHGHGSPYSWRVWLALEFKAAREAEEYVGVEGIDPITTEYFGKEGAAPILDCARRIESAAYIDKTFPPHWR